MNKRAILWITIIILALIAPHNSTAASAAGIHVEGPSIAATHTNITYTVEISGIFDVYRCTMLIAGKNLSGAAPLNQVEKTNNNGIFKFTITTPNATQRIYLDFKGYGIINSTGKTKIFERRVYVDVKNSYTIVASVKNTENYTIHNVTVDFYIDGKYIGNSTIKKIEANSTAKVTYKWVPDVKNGEHELKMKVVGDGVVFQNYQKWYSKSIYIGNPPDYSWVKYLSIGTLITAIVFLGFILLGHRKGKKETKPKWKK